MWGVLHVNETNKSLIGDIEPTEEMLKTYQKLLSMEFDHTLCLQAACKYPNNFDKATAHILKHNNNQTSSHKNKTQNELPITNDSKTEETSPYITPTSQFDAINDDRFTKPPINKRRYDNIIPQEIEQMQSELLSNKEEIQKRLEKIANIKSETNIEEKAQTNETETKRKICSQSTIFVTESPSEAKTKTFEDNYERLRPIGSRGSFGRVYQVKRKSDGKLLAVKEISKSKIYRLRHEDKMRQTLLQFMESEIDVMRLLDHKYIVKMIETFETKHTLYIVMELCGGGELLNRIKNQKSSRYKEKNCKRIIKQICEALFYMHDKHKILHCDLKPSNILFVDHNKTSNIKIVDFGLSTVLPRLQDSLSQLCGTPYYTAPEVIEGKYSHECDMWSVGVITYFMIFGIHPFFVDSNKYFGINQTREIYKLILKGFDPTVKGDYGPWFPRALVGLISKNGMNFIGSLLETNVAKRLTAREALAHPWFSCNEDDEYYNEEEWKENHGSSLMPDDLNAAPFANFCIASKFKYAISGLFHDHYKDMRPKHFENLKQLFKELDTTGDGKISYAEFERGMLKCKDLKLNKNRIKQMFNELDMDKHGEIAFVNLLEAAVYDYLIASDMRLYQAFSDLDANENGKISLDSLKNKISEMNVYDNIDKVLSIIEEVDLDNDGTINYEEFLRALHPDFNETPNWFWNNNSIYDEQGYCSSSDESKSEDVNEIYELQEKARKLKKHLQIEDRKYHLRTYKKCFVGNQCVQTMIKLQYAQTVDEAVTLGNKLIDANIILHVTNDHRFENGYYFYKFVIVLEDEISDTNSCFVEDEMSELQETSRELKQYLEIKDRKYHLKTYRKCFVGSECVQTMMTLQYAQTVKKAVNIGNRLIDANIIRHVTNDRRFENKNLFYKFVVDDLVMEEGFMEKEGKLIQSWRTRYFKLHQNGILAYYKNKNDKNEKNAFDVTQLTKIEPKSWADKRYGIKLCTPARDWKFACENKKERTEWIKAIGQVYYFNLNGDVSKNMPDKQSEPKPDMNINVNNNILLEGWMSKQGKLADTWELRYFKLQKNGFMKLYHDENGTYAIATFNAKKSIRLKRKAWSDDKIYGIKVYTAHRNWKLLCKNDEERNAWMKAIESVRMM